MGLGQEEFEVGNCYRASRPMGLGKEVESIPNRKGGEVVYQVYRGVNDLARVDQDFLEDCCVQKQKRIHRACPLVDRDEAVVAHPCRGSCRAWARCGTSFEKTPSSRQWAS